MKKLSVLILLLAGVTACRAALPQPDLIFRANFAGAQKISAAADVNSFTNEFCSPQALALRKQTADKLAVWLAGWLQTNNGTAVPDGAARLRPLFDDLQRVEWMAEAQAPAGGKPELAMAIKLDAAGAQVWEAGLKPFLPSAKFANSTGWLIFDSGTGTSFLGSTLAQRIATVRPGWFGLDVNWPRLAQWFPEAGKLGLPETVFSVSAAAGIFHMDGKFFFPQNLAMNLESWRFPTNLVHAPFNSFTAVRGFAGWLATQDWAQPYLIAPTPNQAFIWATRDIPFQTFAAVPVPDAPSALNQVYARIQPVFNQTSPDSSTMIQFGLQKSNDVVTLTGLPMVAPYVKATHSLSGGDLFFGGFPSTFSRQPLPAGLFEQLANPNLVFYHWEFTSERVKTFLEPMQMSLFASGHVQLDGDSTAYKWLQNTAPQLGNSITIIAQSAADQLTFTRTGSGIFTAAELYTLANWLEARNFPGCDLKNRPVKRIKHAHPKVPAVVPAPPAPK